MFLRTISKGITFILFAMIVFSFLSSRKCVGILLFMRSSKILVLMRQLSLPFPSNLAFFNALKAVASSLNSIITFSGSS